MNDYLYRRLKEKNGGVGRPEFRAPMILPGALLVPVGIFMYGWGAEVRTPPQQRRFHEQDTNDLSRPTRTGSSPISAPCSSQPAPSPASSVSRPTLSTATRPTQPPLWRPSLCCGHWLASVFRCLPEPCTTVLVWDGGIAYWGLSRSRSVCRRHLCCGSMGRR